MACYHHLLAPHAQYLNGNNPDALQDWPLLFQPHLFSRIVDIPILKLLHNLPVFT
jgi:hypothetical protein